MPGRRHPKDANLSPRLTSSRIYAVVKLKTEKQRISIARAFYTKPEIYVLDDCLSAVDSITERKIVKNLNKLSSKTTSIVVSHRIMSLVKCDNIIVLDEGKIIESGTHTDLIKKNGFYFRMFTNQVQNKTNIL